MIIDSHLHFGSMGDFKMPAKVLIKSMKKYKIDFGIVSNIEAISYDNQQNLIPEAYHYSQLEANQKTLDLVKKYPNKLKGQFWIKPHQEGFKQEVAQFMLKNKDYFVGLKIHPFHSKLKITDKKYEKYLDFAQANNFSVAVHTAKDEVSQPYHLAEVAKKYPEIDFIMVHLGLGTNNKAAIEYVAEIDNLYGDTTWVDFTKVKEAVRKCGSQKILFGSDNPIDGLDTYKSYTKFLQEGQRHFTQQEYTNIFSANAKKIFSLK